MEVPRIGKRALFRIISELKGHVKSEEFESLVNKHLPSGMRFEDIRDAYEGDSMMKKDRKSKPPRPFDITKYRRRHIALRLYYDGSNSTGFVLNDGSSPLSELVDDHSIEFSLFQALKQVRLIDDIKHCKYEVCGRTDAGVSAYGQVVSLFLRSNLKSGVEFADEYDPSILYVPAVAATAVATPTAVESSSTEQAVAPVMTSSSKIQPSNDVEEFDYTKVLNKVLPPYIRVTGWCPVARDFSARFSCIGRVYRYYFLKRKLNIDLMSEGIQNLLGTHDFRNICRIDAVNVHDFKRTIYKGAVVPIKKGIIENEDVFAVEIVGRAFLWHQIRCIMSLLFLIGSERESPSIITHLLDIQSCPCKPQYSMADPQPLVLYDCLFNRGTHSLPHPLTHSLPRVRSSSSDKFIESIVNHPLYRPLSGEASDGPYNTSVCDFEGSMSDVAVSDLARVLEERVYKSVIEVTQLQGLCSLMDDCITHSSIHSPESLESDRTRDDLHHHHHSHTHPLQFEMSRREYVSKRQSSWREQSVGDFIELKTKKHLPLKERQTGPSFEARIEAMSPKNTDRMKKKYKRLGNGLQSNDFIPKVIKSKILQADSTKNEQSQFDE